MWETVFIISSLDRMASETQHILIVGIVFFILLGFYLFIKKERTDCLIALLAAIFCFIAYCFIVPNLSYIKEREAIAESARRGYSDLIIEGEGIVDNQGILYNSIIIDNKEYLIRLEDICPKIPDDAEKYRLYISKINGRDYSELVVRVDAFYTSQNSD